MSLTITSPQSVSSTYAPDLNKQSTPPAPAGSVEAPDQASLSSTSSLVAQAINGSASDVRQDKVAALQQSIASGTYSVSAGDVASKIVDSLLG